MLSNPTHLAAALRLAKRRKSRSLSSLPDKIHFPVMMKATRNNNGSYTSAEARGIMDQSNITSVQSSQSTITSVQSSSLFESSCKIRVDGALPLPTDGRKMAQRKQRSKSSGEDPRERSNGLPVGVEVQFRSYDGGLSSLKTSGTPSPLPVEVGKWRFRRLPPRTLRLRSTSAPNTPRLSRC